MKNASKRIMVIGCCGAGKSTLARKISASTGLEIIHLDQYYWRPNWTETPKEEWGPIVKELAGREQWVMDGNYASSFPVRLPRADLVIYLDYSTISCLWRITRRVAKYWRRKRPDMSEGCHERFNLEFYHYVATFNLTRRKYILQQLAALREDQELVILKKDAEADEFLVSSFG